MLHPDSLLARLLAAPIHPGTVVWIGLRPARRAELLPVAAAEAAAGCGLVGDHYRSRTDGARQVTLVQAEHLAAIASHLGRPTVHAAQLRRNIVVAGINLAALKDRRFRIGPVLLEHSGPCHPCSRMEQTLGPGGYNAVRGHGGITARVLTAGEIRLGDAIRAEPPGR